MLWAYPLQFLFARRPEITGQVLGVVYRCIATRLNKKAGFSGETAQTGAVTLIQRFDWALNLRGARARGARSRRKSGWVS